MKSCRHMFLLATGGTTTVQVDGKSRGACWPQFFTCNVVCKSAEMALAVCIGLDSCSYLSLFRLKAFLLCTPAWQCSYVIIDKTTVSGNTCQGLSIVFERNRIPPIMSWKLVLSHWWHGPALRGTTSQANRWCQEMFYANTAIPSVWEALLLCRSDLGGTNRYGQGSVPSWQTYPAPVFLKAVSEASGTQEDIRCSHHAGCKTCS